MEDLPQFTNLSPSQCGHPLLADQREGAKLVEILALSTGICSIVVAASVVATCLTQLNAIDPSIIAAGVVFSFVQGCILIATRQPKRTGTILSIVYTLLYALLFFGARLKASGPVDWISAAFFPCLTTFIQGWLIQILAQFVGYRRVSWQSMIS